MNRYEARKELCNELARLLAAEPAGRALRLMQWTDLLREPRGTSAERAGLKDSPQGEEPRPISIWYPQEDEGRAGFVRPPVGPFGDHYSSRRRIEVEKPQGTRRICFFGESVAAGYLYSPHLTPAQVLEGQLRELTGPNAVEVVDLARTNETLEGLATTVEAARQLRPDALVIFVGNNWNLLETPFLSPFPSSVRGRQEFALALRGQGLAGPTEMADKALADKVRAAFERIAAAADEVPVVLLLPEVNLLHWRGRQPVAWLPKGGSARWYELLEEGEHALALGEGAAAEAAARQMLELDGGTCPTAHRLLADSLLQQGKKREGEQALRAEVDAERYPLLCFLGAPRATSNARRLLAEVAQLHGFRPVDLAAVFRDFQGGALPGKELFLDYCHLSSEGMHVSMAPAASELLSLWGKSASWEALVADLPRVQISPAVEAVARLGAAVHTAHRWAGEKEEILLERCREALAADPEVAEAFIHLLEARCGPVPAVLSRAQILNRSQPVPLNLQHGWRWEGLDPELLLALAGALEEIGQSGEARLRCLLGSTEAKGGRNRRQQLAEVGRLWDPLERFYPEAMTPAARAEVGFLRAVWPSTSFCLISDGERSSELTGVVRLPAIQGAEGARSGDVRVLVNGTTVSLWKAGESWSRQRAELPLEHLRPGLNKLTLGWPSLPPVGDLGLEAAIRRLDQGIVAEVHPVFGEVFSLEVEG